MPAPVTFHQSRQCRNLWIAPLLLCCGATSSGFELDVYIITGQSNSLGTTSLEVSAGPGEHAADTQTEFYWSNVRSTNVGYPPALYGDSAGSLAPLQTQQGDGAANPSFWGPEFGLARRLNETGSQNVLIIKASRGGGGNTYWDKTAYDADNDAGHMWGHLRDTVDAGLAAVDNADTFQVRGLVYLQGESNSPSEAAVADARLQALIGNLKGHIESTYPGVTDNMHTVVGEIAASGSSSSRIQTTQLQSALASGYPSISFVTTNDLPLKSDGIHFGSAAKLTIGQRFADVFIGVSEQPNGITGDVNQDGVVSTGTGDPLTDDVAAMVAGWQSNTAGLTNLQKTLRGDVNLSGSTTLADVFVLHNALKAQGESFPFGLLTPVPEPNTTALAGCACLAWALAHRSGFRGRSPRRLPGGDSAGKTRRPFQPSG
ncbi:MAG: hypothetical protein KDA37_16500 [Planctomycetales bacterium]|nr:hypothetical protein [Planctomycetales bacterium]